MSPLDELSTLYTTYSVGLDAHDADRFISCFAPEAVVEGPGTSLRGHEELLAWMQASRTTYLHQAFNILVVDDSGPELVSRADWIMYEAGAIIATGTYRDLIAKDEAGRLRFRKRSITHTWLRPQPAA